MRRRRRLVVADRRLVVGVVGGAGGGGELGEEVTEVGDGTGDTERAGVAVAVLLRGAAEERGEGRPAEELGPHGVALHGAAFLADADRNMALRHAGASAQETRAGDGSRGGRLGQRLVRAGGGRAGVRRGHAGEPAEEALHAAADAVTWRSC
ncbi:unnamed protein product [Urochloa decumbens]|uniref:Uncharacterized protein n=1 Tax=Urochloa decumbens TaxID=240449 RepID=A0ABC9EBG1_9POAL